MVRLVGTEYRAQGEELRTTIAVPELRRILTDVDAVPSRAAAVKNNAVNSPFTVFTFFITADW